jgi:hypothetical protein
MQFQPSWTPSNQNNIQPILNNEDPDQIYLDHLYKFMEDQNIPGPDYFEYANTLHEMSKMAGSVPEANLYQLAYLGLKTQGITPEVLIQTALKYISLFEKHRQEFENYLSQDGSSQVRIKTQENDNLQKNNNDSEIKMNELAQQIKNLQQQMVINAQKIAENNNFIETENQKIVIKKSKFEKAFKIVVDKMNGDIQKIKNYVS